VLREFAYPRLCWDIDKSGGHHRMRRTAAMASLNMTSDLAYQAAALGWMNQPDLFNLLAQMVTSEKSPKSAGAPLR
jgi:hypothetical protein